MNEAAKQIIDHLRQRVKSGQSTYLSKDEAETLLEHLRTLSFLSGRDEAPINPGSRYLR